MYLKNCSKDAIVRPVDVVPEVMEHVREVNIPTAKGTNISAWDINPNKSKNYILFLHGMGMNVPNYQKLYKALMDKAGIFALEYKGYGKTAGKQTTEQSLYKDVRNGYKYLTKEKGIKPENIIVVGSCMGGALAINLVKSKKNINSLVLIAPLTSMNTVTNKFIKVKNVRKGMPKFINKLITNNKFFKWIYGKQFNSFDKIKSIKNTEIYILQSLKDTVTRVGGAKMLAKSAARNGNLKEFHLLETGGHKIDQEKIEITARIIEDILSNAKK